MAVFRVERNKGYTVMSNHHLRNKELSLARLSMRKLYDERGNVYFGVDHDIRERLQAKLMMAVLTFKAEE